MSRKAPEFFSLSVATGKEYKTTEGLVKIFACKKEVLANAGSSIMVHYTINGQAQAPIKQYEFKKWLHSVLESAPQPPVPPVPPQDPPAPPVPPVPDPPAPPAPQPPIPPVPPQDPPEPKKRGFWDFLDDIYDWLFE